MCVNKNTHHVFLRQLVKRGKLSYNQRRLLRIYKEQNGKCHWCDTQMNLWWEVTSSEYRHNHEQTATIEHYIPKAKGGKSTKENLVVACHICNATRADIDAEKFEWVTENTERYTRWKELKKLRAIRDREKQEKNAVVRFNKKVVELACTFFLINKYNVGI